MKSTQAEYYKITSNSEPTPMLVKAVDMLGKPGSALDLGCGAGHDTRFLLESGFEVTAVDQDPLSVEYLKKLPHQEMLFIATTSFKKFKFNQYDLVSSWFALSFTPKDHFQKVFSSLVGSLNHGGIFVGNIFGMNDEWNGHRPNMSFFNRSEVEKMLSGLDVIKFIERDEDGTIANGTPKHWHVFIIVARKK